MWEELRTEDHEVFEIMQRELRRQETGLELIASENFVSPAVMQMMGSVLTNKYAEGYPGKRYYGGCVHVDEAERLAISRAKRLFDTEYVNVQPHSGSQANMAAFLAVASPGDTIMGMSLSHGGHLTHGSPVNFSGRLFKAVSYEVDTETETIDYSQLERLSLEVKPKIIIAGGSAYSRMIDFKRFREIADSVGAFLVVDMAHFAGLVAAGLFPNPVDHAHIVTSTTHKTLRGPRGGMIITNDEELAEKVNKNIFPGIQGGPLMHVIAAKAVAFGEALKDEFKLYQERVLDNAKALAENLGKAGLRIVSGGTDTHLFLVDLTESGVTGKAAEKALEKADITVNKNTIPRETRSPFVTSGIRVGTPAVTTRGMGVKEMSEIAAMMARVIGAIEDQKGAANESLLSEVRSQVSELTQRFPLYERFIEEADNDA